MSLAQVSSLETARGSSFQSHTTTQVASNNSGTAAASASSSSSSSTGSGTGSVELRNEFLQMMVAQIQNQDPLNPLDGTQYVTQLAQFSMVEGVENLRVLQQQALVMQDTQQVLQSTNLVGKEVMAPSSSLTLEHEQPVRGQIYLANAADEVSLHVYDQHGQQVATQQWGGSKQGSLDYDLSTLPPGEYSFEVKAKSGGVISTPQNYVAGEVQRVTLPGSGDIQLQVAGVGTVPLFSIVEFGQAKS